MYEDDVYWEEFKLDLLDFNFHLFFILIYRNILLFGGYTVVKTVNLQILPLHYIWLTQKCMQAYCYSKTPAVY